MYSRLCAAQMARTIVRALHIPNAEQPQPVAVKAAPRAHKVAKPRKKRRL